MNQLNRGEDRHKLARAIFHGRRGELRQRYREGQEDQLSALGVVVNIIVLWNASIWMPRLNSFDTKASGLTRRTKPGSPLWFFDHNNLLGRYAFSVPVSIGRGELRPLRNPGDPLEEAA